MFRRKIRRRSMGCTLYLGGFTSKSKKLDVIDELGGSVWLSKILKKN